MLQDASLFNENRQKPDFHILVMIRDSLGEEQRTAEDLGRLCKRRLDCCKIQRRAGQSSQGNWNILITESVYYSIVKPAKSEVVVFIGKNRAICCGPY